MDQERKKSIVNEICTVTFSIGKFYLDKIDFDVIDMDACHILLGRPWQYDKRVVHDGIFNSYSFQWLGKKMVLLHFSPKHNPKQTHHMSTPLTKSTL